MNNLSTDKLAQAPPKDQIIGIFNGFTLEVCLSESSMNRAFQLRYRAYLEAGSIPENEEGLL